jgi:hypothetical protein
MVQCPHISILKCLFFRLLFSSSFWPQYKLFFHLSCQLRLLKRSLVKLACWCFLSNAALPKYLIANYFFNSVYYLYLQNVCPLNRLRTKVYPESTSQGILANTVFLSWLYNRRSPIHSVGPQRGYGRTGLPHHWNDPSNLIERGYLWKSSHPKS